MKLVYVMLLGRIWECILCLRATESLTFTPNFTPPLCDGPATQPFFGSDTADLCCIDLLTWSQPIQCIVSDTAAIQQRYSDTAINTDTSYLMYRQGSGRETEQAAARTRDERRLRVESVDLLSVLSTVYTE